MSWKIAVKKKITPPSPVTGHSLESLKTSKKEVKNKESINVSLITTFIPNPASNMAQSDTKKSTKSTEMKKNEKKWMF